MEIMQNAPSILISVLNWNNATDTIRCLTSLVGLEYSNFEIIVVDNASIDDSIFLIEAAFPEIRIVKSQKNLGYAGGNELAAKIAEKENYDAIWVLNNDAIADRMALSALVQAWNENGDAVFGSIIVGKESQLIEFAGGYELDEMGCVDNSSAYNSIHQTTVEEHIAEYGLIKPIADVNGASIFVPISIIKKVGFISTQFFLYAEEIEYCFRLKKDYDINSYMVNNSIIYHKGSATFENFKELKIIQKYYNLRNFTWLQLQYFNLSKQDIINKYGGRKVFYTRLIKCYFTSLFLTRPYPDTEIIAIFHALLGKLGRVYNPTKYIGRSN